MIGQPLNIARVFHYLGVDPTSGFYEFLDRNGNKTLNPVPYYYPENDVKAIVNLNPKFYGGIREFYHIWSLSV